MASELEPYKLLIAKGDARAIMVGHLINKNLDPIHPATLSRATLQNLLRRDLHYTGLIVSDDMQMKAIADHFGAEDAAVQVLLAGTDILLYRDTKEAQKGYEAVNNALKTKVIKNEDMHLKINRINECKKNNLKDYRPIYIPGIANKINSRASQIFLEDIQKKIAERKTRE